MNALKFYIFGLLACSVGAINIDVTVNGRHVDSIPTGSDVILNCTIPQGDAVDRFDWLKGNQSVPADQVISTSSHSILVLRNASPKTTAVYTCRTWKNNSIKATRPRTVCVDDMKLQVKPRALFLDAGSSEVITCTVQASCGVPSLQWLDQSTNIITDNARIVRTSRTELKLKLSAVSQKDKGIYSCRAVNSAGREVKRKSFFLIVTEVKPIQPPLMTSPRQKASGHYGNNVTLSFSTQFTPVLLTHGVWRHNGTVLHDSPKYTLLKSWPVLDGEQGVFSMTVHNLTEEDSGNYTLRVTTSVAPPAVGHVQLTVHRPVADVEVLPSNRPSQLSTPAATRTVTCEMEYPDSDQQPPRLYWTLNGEKLTSQSKYKMAHSMQKRKGHSTLVKMVLTIFNYSPSDCRWYTCGMITSQGVKEKQVTPCPMNQTDSQVNFDQKTYESSMAWIPITLASVFLLITLTIVFTCLVVKRRHGKIKTYVFYEGFGCKSGQEGSKKSFSSHQADHESHSNPL